MSFYNRITTAFDRMCAPRKPRPGRPSCLLDQTQQKRTLDYFIGLVGEGVLNVLKVVLSPSLIEFFS